MWVSTRLFVGVRTVIVEGYKILASVIAAASWMDVLRKLGLTSWLLLRLVTFVHLSFSVRSLDLFCRFTRVYEGHFVFCYTGTNFKRIAIRLSRDILMFLAAIWSSLCFSSSLYRFLPPLVVLTPHDSNVAVYAQVCWMLCVLPLHGITNITSTSSNVWKIRTPGHWIWIKICAKHH